jgi:hypothetical protein
MRIFKIELGPAPWQTFWDLCYFGCVYSGEGPASFAETPSSLGSTCLFQKIGRHWWWWSSHTWWCWGSPCHHGCRQASVGEAERSRTSLPWVGRNASRAHWSETCVFCTRADPGVVRCGCSNDAAVWRRSWSDCPSVCRKQCWHECFESLFLEYHEKHCMILSSNQSWQWTIPYEGFWQRTIYTSGDFTETDDERIATWLYNQCW